MAKVENLDGGFWSYTYSLFKENHSLESKLIEYGIILLHKYKVEQTQVIFRLLFIFSSQIIRTFGQIEHLHFPNTFLYFFHNITSSGNIHPVTLWKYEKHPIKVSLKISTCSFKKMHTCNLFIKLLWSFYKAFIKLSYSFQSFVNLFIKLL